MEEKDNGYVENTQTEAFATASTGVEESCPKEASAVAGKFKDVDALKKAYDCLQAEFTRRSQRLKQLEREAENFKAKSGSAGVVEKLRENAEKIKTAEKHFDGFIADVERANVRARVGDTLNSEKPAEKMAQTGEAQVQEQMQEQAQIPSVTSADNVRVGESVTVEQGEEKTALEGKSVAIRREVQIDSSEELYRMANADEQVRLKIIGDYLQSLGKAGAPLVKGGNGVLSSPPMKAKTLREAGEMALRWFRQESVEA